MAVEKYGFVYIWRDKKHNRYYVGCHWGTHDDGYVCSSPWMRQAYKHRPNDFHRRILNTGLARDQMYLEEQRVFDMIKPEEVRVRYYNLNLKAIQPWHANENSRLTVGQKISEANKGRIAGPCTPERAKKISEAKKGKKFSEEHKANMGKVRKGRTLSDEHKESIAAGLDRYYQEHEARNKGKPLTDAHRKSISDGMVGKKRNGYTQSEATKAARAKAVQAATEAKLGSRAYNNGVIEKRCKEHPGEGWVLGGLKRQKSKAA